MNNLNERHYKYLFRFLGKAFSAGEAILLLNLLRLSS
jgi:hypothetical protein